MSIGKEPVCMGDALYIDGFIDGYWGRPVTSDDKVYLDAYGRGYETAQRQAEVRNGTSRNSQHTRQRL